MVFNLTRIYIKTGNKVKLHIARVIQRDAFGNPQMIKIIFGDCYLITRDRTYERLSASFSDNKTKGESE